MSASRVTDPPPHNANIAKARHIYELLRLLLVVMLTAIVLSSLVLGLLQGRRIEQLAVQNHELGVANHQQAVQVGELLDRVTKADGRRQRDINGAVWRIFAQQKRDIDAHDANVQARFLQLERDILALQTNRRGR